MSLPAITVLAALIVVLAGEKWRLARRRHELNRTLHEIRRPLQALVLLSPAGQRPPAAMGGGVGLCGRVPSTPRVSLTDPVLQVISAVSDLDRQLNGGPRPGRRCETVAARLMADACVRRWQSRAALSGSRIELRWPGPDGLLRGDGVALASALENLIVNAIEHGGPRIAVVGRSVGKRIVIEVLDDGVAARPESRPAGPAQAVAKGRAKGRRGHGLDVAANTALEHRGRIETSFAPEASRAALILPRSERPARRSRGIKVNW